MKSVKHFGSVCDFAQFRKLILFASVMLALPARADDLVYRDGRVTVRFRTSVPCASEKLTAALATVSTVPAMAAQVIIRGKEIVGCWSVLPDASTVILGDEAGGGGIFPPNLLKVVPDV
jgi:hypothetical protein